MFPLSRVELTPSKGALELRARSGVKRLTPNPSLKRTSSGKGRNSSSSESHMKNFLAAMIAALLLWGGVAQAKECESSESFNAAQAEIDQSLAALGSDLPLSKIESKLTTLGWPKEKQTKSLKAVFSSQPMAKLQKEENVYIAALSDAVVSSSGPSPQVSKCEAAKQVKILAGKIMAVNKRQYEYAARAIGLTNGSAK